MPTAIRKRPAKKVLQRILFINRISSVFPLDHKKQLEERILLAENATDFPDWWESGKHDLQLLRGVAK